MHYFPLCGKGQQLCDSSVLHKYWWAQLCDAKYTSGQQLCDAKYTSGQLLFMNNALFPALRERAMSSIAEV